MKGLVLFLFALASTAAFGKTAVTSVSISPQGAVLQTGSSLQFSASCTYADGSTDNCSAAGGVTWSSSQTPTLTVSGSGIATWNTDPGSGNSYALGHVVVSAGGFTDNATIMGQHVGDVFYQYPTPDYTSYRDAVSEAQLPLNVVVGSTVTMGSGFVINEPNPGYRTGSPFQMTCSWSSSNPAVAAVDRYGQVTAISPGTVDITCGRAGNGVYGRANSSAWIAPGNVLTLTVVPGVTSKATWYVRPHGGTAFINAALTPNGQCDGLHDTDYPGQGVNQPCAVNNLRNLYFDGVNHHRQQWMISGGDTVIVRQNPAGYPVAYDAPYVPTNCDDSYCDVPSIPSGTSAQHTRILGENYASCHADSAKTLLVLYGREAISVRDSQFVDVSCFEITDQSACGPGGFSNASCPSGSHGGAYGITESALTSNVSYNDIFIHGLVVAGIHGATGVGVVANYVHIRGMPFAGIDMDDGSWMSSNISVAGGFTMKNSITEFTGCVEEYPVVHNYPYIECRDQATNGYGDGFGTANTTGNWVFDHDIWRYNFQDGLDLLHSGMQNLSITNSQSYGNDGQAYKIGAATNVVFRNNFALVNCNRIASTVGDEPASAIVPGVSTCRAGGDWIPLNFSAQGTYLIQNNTLAGYGAVPFDLACETGWGDCSHATAVYQNNVILGYSNPNYNGGQTASTFYLEYPSNDMPPLNGWSQHDHNLFYNVRPYNCPSTLFAGETCNTVDPKLSGEGSSTLSGESALDALTYNPLANSPLLGAGTPIAGLLTDIAGNTRSSKPSIGAMDVSGTASVSVPPPSQQTTSVTLGITPGSAVAGASVSLYVSTSSGGSTLPTGTVTFTSGGTTLGTATLNSGSASFTSSSIPVGAYSITASYAGDSNFAPATSNSASLTVTAPSKPQAVVSLAANPNPAMVGQTLTLLASITPSSTNSPSGPSSPSNPSGQAATASATPTGTITFSFNGSSFSTSLDSSGNASVSVPSSNSGTFNITASYSGDGNFGPSAANPIAITIAPQPPSRVSISVAQPAAGFNVIPGSTRRVFAQVTNGATGQVSWSVKSGSAQISANSGSWIDITAGNSGSSCQIAKSGNAVASSTQFTVEATSVDDTSKKSDLTFNVCSPAVQVSTIPAYRTLYANQPADIQSLVVGSVNDEVHWMLISQPSGGDGKLVDATARDTVFNATVPGRYTVAATSVADQRQVATSILYVTGHNMPYHVSPNRTEPVDCSVDPSLLGTTYEVGPSQTYHRVKDVPFNRLFSGSTIRIHNEDTTGATPTTYHEYLQLSQRGTPDQPIRICGVPDAAGNLPILDAANATGRTDVTASVLGSALVSVGGSTTGSAWPSYSGAQNLIVEGLHLRNARAGVPYTTPTGSGATWASSAACIRIGDGHNISLIGDEMDGCSNGAASLWNGTTWGGSSLNHLWEGNYIHGSGTAGSSANHQMYLQGWGEVVQFNRIDGITPGNAGANLKSRGVQDVIRYNYFGDGSARNLDLVDVAGAAQWMSFGDFFGNNTSPTNSTYSMDQLAAWQEAWNSHFAYGNTYLNSTSLAPIHFAYDASAAEPARKGNLYWYNNTFYQGLCSGCSGQLFTMFDTSSGNSAYLPQTEFQTVQAFNNLVWMDNSAQPVFQWNNFDAFIGVGGNNLLPAGWGADTLHGGVGDGWNATANNAAYQNAGNLSLHITGFDSSSVQTSSSMPFDKVSWTLSSTAPATAKIPFEACEMPTRFTYLPTLGYAVPRSFTPNTGAADTPVQTAAVMNLIATQRPPSLPATTCN